MAENALLQDVRAELDTCIERYLQPCVPGETLTRVMAVFADHERYAIELAPVVEANPAYAQFVLRTDFLRNRIKDWVSEMPEGQANYRVILERVFSLLGKQAGRNLVACIRLNRLLGTVPKKASERMALLPKDQIKMAIAAEEFCQARDYAYSEIAFQAGLQFDFLAAALARAKAPREALANLPVAFAEHLKLAHIAYELGTQMRAFKFNRFVFPAALSLGLGVTLQSALHPKEQGAESWNAFMNDVEKQKYSRVLFRELEEAKRFALTAADLSALFMSWFRFLKPVERAVAHAMRPSDLKHEDEDQYLLAALLHLAMKAQTGDVTGPTVQRLLTDLSLFPDHVKRAITKAAAK